MMELTWKDKQLLFTLAIRLYVDETLKATDQSVEAFNLLQTAVTTAAEKTATIFLNHHCVNPGHPSAKEEALRDEIKTLIIAAGNIIKELREDSFFQQIWDFDILFSKALAHRLQIKKELLSNPEEHSKAWPSANIIRAKHHFKSGEYISVIFILNFGLKNSDYHPNSLFYYLAKSYLHLKKYTKAKSLLELLLKKQGNLQQYADYHDSLGLCYFNLAKDSQTEEFSTAIKHFLLAIQSDPLNRNAPLNLALLYLQTKAYSQSQELITPLLGDAHCPFALHAQGSWHEAQENYTLAIDFYLKAKTVCPAHERELLVAINTNLAASYAEIGHIYFRQKMYEDARVNYQRAIAFDLGHTTAINQIGMTFFYQENWAAARSYFNQLCDFPPRKIKPQITETAQALTEIKADGWLGRAECLRRERKLKAAKIALHVSQTLFPENEGLGEEKKELAATTIQHYWHFFTQKSRTTADFPAVLPETAGPIAS